MNKKILHTLVVICLASLHFACNSSLINQQSFIDSYEVRKKNVLTYRDKLIVGLNDLEPDEKNRQLVGYISSFETVLLDSIIQTWYGTDWDFHGTSVIPGKGAIACGYFVTTTLLHSGVELNRVRLSQCASEEMIINLVEREHIHRYSNYSIEKYIKAIKKEGRGIYITGLDNHTGFTWFDGNEVWFIHSSGTSPYQVIKEKALETSLLAKSKYRVVGKISTLSFMKKWLKES